VYPREQSPSGSTSVIEKFRLYFHIYRAGYQVVYVHHPFHSFDSASEYSKARLYR
jgi:hypothetical protein